MTAPHPQRQRALRWGAARRIRWQPGLATISLLVATASCSQYRPDVDLTPLLSLPERGPIDTLRGDPNSNRQVEKGPSQHTPDQQSDAPKEQYYVERNGITFGFWVFFTEEAAKRFFVLIRDRSDPVFQERETEHRDYRIHYLQRQSTDAPLPIYRTAIGRVNHSIEFRTYNVVATIWFLDDRPNNQKLAWSVGELADMLQTGGAARR